jgi:hypothetical protein
VSSAAVAVTDFCSGDSRSAEGSSRSPNTNSRRDNWRPSMAAMVSSCSRTCSASGLAKMVRIAAATISADPTTNERVFFCGELHRQ